MKSPENHSLLEIDPKGRQGLLEGYSYPFQKCRASAWYSGIQESRWLKNSLF